MNAMMRTFAVVGALAILTLGGASAQAQGTAPAYYYPSAGYYATTAGTVYIPAPGYYYNVPGRYAGPTVSGYGPATSPGWGYGYGYPPSRGYRPRGGGGPNNPPYYSSAVHSLHGRGIDSSRHGR